MELATKLTNSALCYWLVEKLEWPHSWKLKKSDGQMKIYKYRVIAHTILHNIISEQNFDMGIGHTHVFRLE